MGLFFRFILEMLKFNIIDTTQIKVIRGGRDGGGTINNFAYSLQSENVQERLYISFYDICVHLLYPESFVAKVI